MEELNEAYYKRFMFAIEIAYKEILNINCKLKSSNVDKQMNLFQKYLAKGNYETFKKKSIPNLEKLNGVMHADTDEKIAELLSQKHYSEDMISQIVVGVEKARDVKEALTNLSRSYSQKYLSLKSLNMVKNMSMTDTFVEEKPVDYKKNVSKSESISDDSFDELRPKKPSIMERLRGVDVNKNKVGELYGMAGDIFYLMTLDQNTQVNRYSENSDDLYHQDFTGKYEMTKADYFDKYKISSMEELLNKYNNLIIEYKDAYDRLSPQLQENYKISSINSYMMPCKMVEADKMYTAFTFENFKFPPNKTELTNIMNKRIISSINFDVISTSIYDVEKKEKVEKYYKNLTKNMDSNEMVSLYNSVVNDMYKRSEKGYSNFTKEHYGVMQKLFCDIIIDKEKINVNEYGSIENTYEHLIENVLKSEVAFSLYGNSVNEEKTQDSLEDMEENNIQAVNEFESNKTEYASYINYKIRTPKEDQIPFNEFVEERKSKRIEMPKEMFLNEDIILEENNKEEIKGRSR